MNENIISDESLKNIYGGKMTSKTNHILTCVILTGAGFVTGSATPLPVVGSIGGAMMAAAGACF